VTVSATYLATLMSTVTLKQNLVINEIDYDNIGSPDLNEFVEIFNPTPATVDLSNLSLVFVNGANNMEYKRVDLSGSLASGAYLVVGSSTVVVPVGVTKINFTAAGDNIQNGAPDGVLIIDKAGMTIVDALSYEGSITAAVIMGWSGTYSLVEGTVLNPTVADSNTVDGSLIREPNGIDTDNANNDWKFTTTKTPGAANIP
jgi:hypothetical protein